jgi:hypothetical protein
MKEVGKVGPRHRGKVKSEKVGEKVKVKVR